MLVTSSGQMIEIPSFPSTIADKNYANL